MRILSTNLVNLNPNGNSNKLKNSRERENITGVAGEKTQKIIKLIKTSPEAAKEINSKISPVTKKLFIFKKSLKS